jgi:hypothetical protein
MNFERIQENSITVKLQSKKNNSIKKQKYLKLNCVFILFSKLHVY